jgi:hypothetical protein
MVDDSGEELAIDLDVAGMKPQQQRKIAGLWS